MTLSDYFNALASFDWQFERSDDHAVFSEGHARRRELFNLSSTSAAHKRLYVRWQRYGMGITTNKPRMRGEKS